MEKAFKDFLNNPYAGDTVHKFRGDTRKLRSVLNLLKKRIANENYQELNQPLRDFGMLFSNLREYDVLIEMCSNVAKEHSDLSSHYRELFSHLHSERYDEMYKVLNIIAEQGTGERMEKVLNAARGIEFDTNDLNGHIEKRLVKRYKKLMTGYNSLDSNNYERVHQIRKDGKKLRFSAKYLGKETSLDHKKMEKEAKAVQDELGEATDAHVNHTLLNNFATTVDDDNVKELFKQIAVLVHEDK